MASSRLTFSAAAARAARNADLDTDDEEPGEVIESAPPQLVGEERDLGGVAGLRKKLLRQGAGWETPVAGDEVTVHYVGAFEDGSKFSSSRDTDLPLTFKLGQGEVVSCLDLGVATMKKGELALFTLPSALGYGSAGGAHGVPPDSVLQYEVELILWLAVVDICKDGGIVKKILSPGDDTQAGDLDEVTVKYQVRLLDGTVVCESPEEGFKYHVNEGHLCPALSKAVRTMRKGEKAFVVVQPRYAFGGHGRSADQGFHAIPSNASLNIDLELVSLKPVLDVTGDLKVLKMILKFGEGTSRPNEGSTVEVRYTAMLEHGSVVEKIGFDGPPFAFVLDEEQVIAGLDLAVGTMLKGEISKVTVNPDYGYGNIEVKRDLGVIPPNSILIFEVELTDFTKEKEPWEMGSVEKIEAAKKTKNLGNDLYKLGNFRLSAKKYGKAVNYVHEDGPFDGIDEKLVQALRVSCWSNHAACSLKLNDFREALRLCSKVLEVEPMNVKALYRRAQAYVAMTDLDLATRDIKKALEVEPQNREVRSLQTTLKQLQAESDKRDAKLYANMFERMKKDANMALKKLKVEKPDQAIASQSMEMEVSDSVTPGDDDDGVSGPRDMDTRYCCP